MTCSSGFPRRYQDVTQNIVTSQSDIRQRQIVPLYTLFLHTHSCMQASGSLVLHQLTHNTTIQNVVGRRIVLKGMSIVISNPSLSNATLYLTVVHHKSKTAPRDLTRSKTSHLASVSLLHLLLLLSHKSLKHPTVSSSTGTPHVETFLQSDVPSDQVVERIWRECRSIRSKTQRAFDSQGP